MLDEVFARSSHYTALGDPQWGSIVDDEQPNSSSAKLPRGRLPSHEAQAGAQALEIARVGRSRRLITDQRMPEMPAWSCWNRSAT